MTLYQRTILIIVSTFIALLFILAATSDLILLSSFSALEKNDVTSHLQNVMNQIDDKLKQMHMSSREIAEQLQESGGVSASSGALLTERYMRSHTLDLAAVYDKSGGLVAIRGFDCEKGESRQLPARQQQALGMVVYRIASGDGTPVQGVVNLDGSPVMVALTYVKGDSRVKPGIVATGWFIDNVEMERIFRASGASIEAYDLNGSLLPDVVKAVQAIDSGSGTYVGVIDAASVAGYFTLKDVFGQQSFVVRAVEKRRLHEQGKVTITYIFASLFLAGGVLCVVMLAFVRSAILTRLITLTAMVRHITEKRDISARVPLSEHDDELMTLSVSINSMLDSLENAEAGMRESEERYRMLFERAPDAIIIIGVEGDEAGRIVAANQAAADQHGYTTEELCSLRIFDLNTPKTNEIAGDLMANIVAGEWLTAEIWHQKKDGTRFPIEIHTGLIKINGKKYILGFDRDITQRKLTEKTDYLHLEQIRQLNDELSRKAIDLAAANNELETFNYSVSHDMRGPLTRISGYCQLLLDEECELDPTAKEYVDRIYESEIWLNEMIDALLHLATLTRAEIVSDTVNLSRVVEEAIEELALENPERFVRTDIEPDIIVAGDVTLLKMAMINLLNNAWKYSSGKDEAVIEFGADRSGPETAYYIRDNGAGFDMKDADKLFRVFTRLHDSSQFPGTGIGLATVQRIIFRHGGRVWGASEPGKGATIFFTLP
jgi:PAS domain S-box-containing protein